MKVIIGADHRGVITKEKIGEVLKKHGYSYEDVGAFESETSCDYPHIALDVGTRVVETDDAKGILVCMSGIGQAMAANKVRGAYAALCYNAEAAKLARQHNNANVLVIGAKFVDQEDLEGIILAFLTTDFEGGRHQRRVDQIKKIEDNM